MSNRNQVILEQLQSLTRIEVSELVGELETTFDVDVSSRCRPTEPSQLFARVECRSHRNLRNKQASKHSQSLSSVNKPAPPTAYF